MSILIKGMDMPKSCWLCHLSVFYEKPREMLMCSVIKEEVLRNKIDGNCPLVEIPPHGDLIDRSKLAWTPIDITDLPLSGECLPVYLKEDVDDAPTIIEAEEGE